MRSVFLLLSPAFALQTSFIQADGCEGIITFHEAEGQDLERQFCNFLREVANAHNIPLGGGYSSSATWSAGKIEEVYAKLMNKVEGAQKGELQRAHQSNSARVAFVIPVPTQPNGVNWTRAPFRGRARKACHRPRVNLLRYIGGFPRSSPCFLVGDIN